MCGRFTLTSTPEDLARVFGLDPVDLNPTDLVPIELAPRFNIAPQQDVATVAVSRESGIRQLRMLRWGLVPHWADDPRIGARMINARCETAAQKPAFRSAFRKRRCLVPSSGFYEWRREADGNKQPYFIAFAGEDNLPFGIAGLYEEWRGEGGELVESCTLLTTQANETLATLHHRMPVILDPTDFERWLAPELTDPEQLIPLLRPLPAGVVTLRPVSPHVNDARTDDASCLAPYDPAAAPVQGALF